LLDKVGYKDRAAEMQTLADPTMKALALNSTKELSKDLEKNTIYLWVALSQGEFCAPRSKNGYVTDGFYPLPSADVGQTTVRCLLDILLAVITLGDVSLDGAGEI